MHAVLIGKLVICNCRRLLPRCSIVVHEASDWPNCSIDTNCQDVLQDDWEHLGLALVPSSSLKNFWERIGGIQLRLHSHAYFAFHTRGYAIDNSHAHALLRLPFLIEIQAVPSRSLILDHVEIFRRQPKGFQYAIAQLFQFTHHIRHLSCLALLQLPR